MVGGRLVEDATQSFNSTASALSLQYKIVEASGSWVRRYIEFADGGKVELSPHKALTCNFLERKTGLVLTPSAAADVKRRNWPVRAATQTSRAKPSAPATAKIHSGLARVQNAVAAVVTVISAA